ncbi:MAG: Holliday junction branch migration protein RuvA [Bacteroidia bacterium]|nr:Holliday junction branch migration protein RuvA [Bacteroidia bacterium]
MLDYVRGKIVKLNPAQIVVETNGIGFSFQISLQSFTRWKEQGIDALVFVESLYVRDDLPRHYGFFDEQERELFRKITSVSGVGGSSAMLMLSSLTPDEIITAINTANITPLKSIKGIGDKTAQRIIVDLKGKLGKHEGGIGKIVTEVHNKNREEALLALVALGFNRTQADKALDRSLKELGSGAGVDALVRLSLKFLQ